MSVTPVCRYLIVCDRVTADPSSPLKVNLMGVVSAIKSTATPRFPVHRPELAVYSQFTDCHGPVVGHLRVTSADDGRLIASIPDRALPLPNDPLDVAGVLFRVRNCTFPAAGLYWIELWCEGKRLQEAPLNVR